MTYLKIHPLIGPYRAIFSAFSFLLTTFLSGCVGSNTQWSQVGESTASIFDQQVGASERQRCGWLFPQPRGDKSTSIQDEGPSRPSGASSPQTSQPSNQTQHRLASNPYFKLHHYSWLHGDVLALASAWVFPLFVDERPQIWHREGLLIDQPPLRNQIEGKAGCWWTEPT